MKFFKYLVVCIILTIYITPTIVLGATTDPRCYTKPDCIEARTSFLNKEEAAINPLYQGSDTKKVCGGSKNEAGDDIGFCFPSVQAITEVNIGGQNTFKNIGEYIKVVYTYAIIAAGIVAVIVIIISGIQWTASGGNSGIIQSAKSRIINAIVGLIIAVGSFVILNTLNPYLINFRVPQAWLLKPIVLSANLCVDLPDTSSIFEFGKATEKKNEQQINEAKDKAKYKSIKTEEPKCENQYLVKGAENVCMGSVCKPDKETKQSQVCVNHVCVKGRVSGNIINSAPDKSETWGSDMVDGKETEIWIICNNGENFEIKEAVVASYSKTGNNKAEYLMTLNDPSLAAATSLCTSKKGVAGFMLKLEMDEASDPKDENHWIGKEANGDVVDLGDDEAAKKTVEAVGKDPLLANKYLISELEMTKGFTFNIDIAKISDIDNINPFIGKNGTDQRNILYGKKFGVSF